MKSVKIGSLVKKMLSVSLVHSSMKNEIELKVHSVFQSGFNMQIDNQLIFIGNLEKGITPFGLHMETSEFLRLKEAVKMEKKLSVFFPPTFHTMTLLANGETFHFDEVEEHDGNLTIHQPFVESKKIQGIKLLTGLDFTEELEENSETLSCLFSTNEEKIERGLTYYLGRGCGLTPSGDDFLVGLLSVDSHFNLLDSQFYPILEKLLHERRTTDVSTMYLRAALQKKFSSLIIDFLSQTHESSFLALLASGSTSGADTMAGIFVGMKRTLKT
ncbi:DUF2877 domain-containing protein [Pilibacter termitis]|nr:DUF2877 domain-containing protein [Pilibacter termitis]